MASILKRGPHQWQSTIRRKGYPTQTKTHETKAAAEAWATVIESQMTLGSFVDRTLLEKTTLGDVLTRYGEEESPKKLSCRTELVTIRRLLRHPLAKRSLASLRNSDFAEYRDERLKEPVMEKSLAPVTEESQKPAAEKSRRLAAPNSVRLELALLSTVFTTAKQEWSIEVDNSAGFGSVDASR